MQAPTGLKETLNISEALKTAIEAARAAGDVLRFYWTKIYQTENSSYQEHYKQDTSLQTTADIEAEEIILSYIKKKFPSHAIDSEERGYIQSGTPEYLWVIDPLDGTENFVQGIPYFSSSITLCKRDEPLLAVVYNPIAGHLYSAKRGHGAELITDGPEQHQYSLCISQTEQLKKCRAFFIPDFVTKHQPSTDRTRNTLYKYCRRVFDSWSPALDWCLVASGKADAVIAIADNPIRPDAGILILQEAGGKVTDFYNNDFPGGTSQRLVGSNGNNALHSALLELVNDNHTDIGGQGTGLYKNSLERD
jgi:myo-inositol-1(or 4)-monophosphatase